MNLVVVESPAKAKTINKYLGKIIRFWQVTDILEIYPQKWVG